MTMAHDDAISGTVVSGRVLEIIEHEQTADRLQEESDWHRWEAARKIAEELADGKSQRKLAREIGKTHPHITYVMRALDLRGNPGYQSFNDAYQAAKKAKKAVEPAPDPAPDPEPEEDTEDQESEMADEDDYPVTCGGVESPDASIRAVKNFLGNLTGMPMKPKDKDKLVKILKQALNQLEEE